MSNQKLKNMIEYASIELIAALQLFIFVKADFAV